MQLSPLDSFAMPPTELPEAGQREWLGAMQELQPSGVLAAADLSLLKSYCQHVATMERAAHELNTPGGYLIHMHNKGGGVYLVKSPWVSIYNEASDRAARLGQQFGLTPVARTRISIPTPVEPKDPWADFE